MKLKIIVFNLFFILLNGFCGQVIKLSDQIWFLNNDKITIPHSYEYLDQNFKVINETCNKNGIYKTILPKICSLTTKYNFILKVDAAYQICAVHVNDKLVDEDFESGFLPSYFNITSYLTNSETNTLKITTSIDRSGSIIPLAGDYYKFGGIYRDVWLIVLDKNETFNPYSDNEYKPPALTYDKDDGWFKDKNNHKVFLKGVNYHQYLGLDWNYNEEKELKDLMLIKAMGANAIRTAHYLRSSKFYELCDKLGLYVFTELPINQRLNTNSLDHLERYAEKMVYELRKYPCVISYGIYNELHANNTYEIRYLNDIVHSIDNSRPTYAATQYNLRNCAEIQDILGLNYYGGWYDNQLGPLDIAKYCRQRHQQFWQPSFFITEYGAGANINQTSKMIPLNVKSNMIDVVEIVGNKTNHHYVAKGSPNNSYWQPADYQELWHKIAWKIIENDPYCNTNCAGVFIWQMFDTPAPRKEGGTTNINTKGIMTIDRIPKPTYYFYKNVWNAKSK